MACTYNFHVLELLRARFVIGLSPEALLRFKKCYGSSAYVCQYHSCIRATVGFASAEDLEKHEFTHKPKFACGVSNCHYSTTGFRTLNSLKQHTTNYHVSEMQAHIPQPFRRARRVNRTEMRNIQSPTPPSHGQVVPAPRFLEDPSLEAAHAQSVQYTRDGPNALTFQLMQAITASHTKMKAQNPMSWQAQMPPAERLGIIRSM